MYFSNNAATGSLQSLPNWMCVFPSTLTSPNLNPSRCLVLKPGVHADLNANDKAKGWQAHLILYII